jgi:TonB family protein
MPNLTSGSGSWVLLFAELDDAPRSQDESEELSSPVAMRKIDPQYTPSAVRDRIEGTVMLAAHILRDGRVSNVHVMRGVDPRLDSSAMEALTEWEFVPAKRKGVPVDLEVLVQIPFRLPPPRTF